jgi:hypothetical protein
MWTWVLIVKHLNCFPKHYDLDFTKLNHLHQVVLPLHSSLPEIGCHLFLIIHNQFGCVHNYHIH